MGIGVFLDIFYIIVVISNAINDTIKASFIINSGTVITVNQKIVPSLKDGAKEGKQIKICVNFYIPVKGYSFFCVTVDVVYTIDIQVRLSILSKKEERLLRRIRI